VEPAIPKPEKRSSAARQCDGKAGERGMGCFGAQLRKVAGRVHAAFLVFASLVLCFAHAPPADAREEKAYRIAMVLQGPEGEVERAFEEYFAKRNVLLRTTMVPYSGHLQDQPALIRELRRLAPDLIYTSDTATTLAIAGPLNADRLRYITDVPVVFTSVSDPVAAGLVVDLKRPGRLVTGVIPVAPMNAQINTVSAYRHLGALGFLYRDAAQSLAVRDKLRALGGSEGFKLLDAAVPLDKHGDIDVEQLPSLASALKRDGADFLYIGPETFVTKGLQKAAAQAALDADLPTYSALESAVRDNGALLGMFSPKANIGRFAALKALRVLTHAAAPGDEPIESLERFSILINMQTARRLQLYPPLLLLDAADVVAARP
jgi:ABC-type uncharacterized transport system substrate-binding protein